MVLAECWIDTRQRFVSNDHMASPPDDYLGSVKYEGKLVEEGILEARAASQALAGIDSALKYFIGQESPALGSIDFPIPVQTRKGSWEALIPTTIWGWMVTAAGLGASAYITAAAKKLAENDFKDVTLKAIFQKALLGIQAVIEMGKHLGHLEFRKVAGLRWDREEHVGVPNAAGLVLYIRITLWQQLVKVPSNLLSKLAAVIEHERSLVVAVRVGEGTAAVTVNRNERHIFVSEDELDDTFLFPELTHGAPVALDGIVTRENGRAKTLGFLYQDHVLTCMPASGNMLPFKKHLFLRCRIHGEITRLDEQGQPTEKRPKIVFTDLEILSDKEQLDLGLTGPEDDA